MLLLDGVYAGAHVQPRFQRVKAPDRAELEQPVYTISERTGRYLERQGLLVCDMDNSYLALEPAEETGLEGVLGSSITSATAPALLYLLLPCSRTVLPWGHSRGVRPSACRVCRRRAAWKRPVRGWQEWPASRCMPGWLPPDSHGNCLPHFGRFVLHLRELLSSGPAYLTNYAASRRTIRLPATGFPHS